ncbi:unnamed protein product [Paramecium primaurelia]|uniref:Uncharacterized protein n=1 Tax=Paramecium primaurelia TaxID=5886 RepID=A0A8S1JZ64_PARPR|nr:unnamed protein product [Paramecium primaurelia]
METLLKKTMKLHWVLIQPPKYSNYRGQQQRQGFWTLLDKKILDPLQDIIIESIRITLVFYMKNSYSFENIKSWQLEINQYAKEKIILILIANKSDLMQKSKQIESQYIETSALNGKKIEESLQLLSQSILKLIQENQIDLTNKNCGVLLRNKAETLIQIIIQDICKY